MFIHYDPRLCGSSSSRSKIAFQATKQAPMRIVMVVYYTNRTTVRCFYPQNPLDPFSPFFCLGDDGCLPDPSLGRETSLAESPVLQCSHNIQVAETIEWSLNNYGRLPRPEAKVQSLLGHFCRAQYPRRGAVDVLQAQRSIGATLQTSGRSAHL